MILDGMRHHDDPGLERRLLGASNAIERPLPAFRPRLCVGEAAVVALFSLLLWLVLVALP
jgi:hypothetical protein